ncbi:sulfotransferase [Azospirillum sp. ST 5-10]|uniref:sulfotransferase n=1 Tax=unclassified Azospirillum TaxID=2630922 RepID=UPI003F4A7E5D
MIRPSALLLPTEFGQSIARSLGRGGLCRPVVIGATGGSGTRAVRAVLDRAGVFMGANVNNVGDAMDYEPLLDELINRILEETHATDYEVGRLSPRLREPAIHRLRTQIRVYLRDRPRAAGRWGWKNPRSMYILPLIHAVFPEMCFVHVVRDGRDMAVSTNQWQFRKHHDAMFGRAAAEDETAVASCALWGRANLGVAEWGERVMGGRYIRIRLEDLCTRPLDTVSDLLHRLDLDPAAAAPAAALVETPPSLYRWQRLLDEATVRTLEEVSGDALRRFGYLGAATPAAAA